METHIVDKLNVKPETCLKWVDKNLMARPLPLTMPYVVLVLTIVDPSKKQEYAETACAGTMVSDDVVLTAASCLIQGSRDHPSEKHTFMCTRPVRVLKAIKIFLHPQYTRSEERFNVALISVDPSKHNVKVLPKMPTKDLSIRSLIDKGGCVVGGYGVQRVNRHPSVKDFYERPIKNATVLQCRGKKPLICLHFEDLLPCDGDVGSPIVCNDELYAVFTPKLQIDPKICLDRYGIAFTQVFYLKEFIERVDNIPATNMEWMSNPFYILLLCGLVLAVIGGIYYCIMTYLQKRFETMVKTEATAHAVESVHEQHDAESVDEQEAAGGTATPAGGYRWGQG